jgi:uncharacterized membrane protein
MAASGLKPSAAIGGVPIHAMLVPFPIVCFTGAMITDIIYANTAVIQYTDFSSWLLAFGLFMGALAALFGMFDLFRNQAADRPTIAWVHMIGNFAVLALALVNSFVHARDAWTSVVPTGLTLSIITVLLLVVTGFLGHRLAYRHVARDER